MALPSRSVAACGLDYPDGITVRGTGSGKEDVGAGITGAGLTHGASPRTSPPPSPEPSAPFPGTEPIEMGYSAAEREMGSTPVSYLIVTLTALIVATSIVKRPIWGLYLLIACVVLVETQPLAISVLTDRLYVYFWPPALAGRAERPIGLLLLFALAVVGYHRCADATASASWRPVALALRGVPPVRGMGRRPRMARRRHPQDHRPRGPTVLLSLPRLSPRVQRHRQRATRARPALDHHLRRRGEGAPGPVRLPGRAARAPRRPSRDHGPRGLVLPRRRRRALRDLLPAPSRSPPVRDDPPAPAVSRRRVHRQSATCGLRGAAGRRGRRLDAHLSRRGSPPAAADEDPERRRAPHRLLRARLLHGHDLPGASCPRHRVDVLTRTPVDDIDASSNLYRTIENHGLMATIRQHPFLGWGFGRPFQQPVALPDISPWNPYYRLHSPQHDLLGLDASGPARLSRPLVPAGRRSSCAARSSRDGSAIPGCATSRSSWSR